MTISSADPLDQLPWISPTDGNLSEDDVTRLEWAVGQVRRIVNLAPMVDVLGSEISPGLSLTDAGLRAWVSAVVPSLPTFPT